MNISLDDRVSLFCECFGDTRDVAETLYACSDIINVSINNEDGLAAMASLVPILAQDYKAKGYYVYGVCVAPQRRGRGLFREIMKRSEAEAKKMGYTIPVFQRFDSVYASSLRLVSCEFREFAKSDSHARERHRGLLKILNITEFNPENSKLSFIEDMGDV